MSAALCLNTNSDPNQPALDFKDLYDYEVIVTNMEDLPPEEVWRWYNKRLNVENEIDELKTGLAIDQTSQHEMLRNTAFMWFFGCGWSFYLKLYVD